MSARGSCYKRRCVKRKFRKYDRPKTQTRDFKEFPKSHTAEWESQALNSSSKTLAYTQNGGIIAESLLRKEKSQFSKLRLKRMRFWGGGWDLDRSTDCGKTTLFFGSAYANQYRCVSREKTGSNDAGCTGCLPVVCSTYYVHALY